MKDSRVIYWTNPQSHLTGTTTNTGPTIDLQSTYTLTGSNIDHGGHFGFGVEIIQSRDTGTAQVTVWEFEVSADASTWRKGGFIGSNAMDAAGVIRRIKCNLQTPARYRYFRLLASNTGTGTSTSNAYAEDCGNLTVIAASNG